MKRAAVLILVLVACVIVIGCGNGSNPATSDLPEDIEVRLADLNAHYLPKEDLVVVWSLMTITNKTKETIVIGERPRMHFAARLSKETMVYEEITPIIQEPADASLLLDMEGRYYVNMQRFSPKLHELRIPSHSEGSVLLRFCYPSEMPKLELKLIFYSYSWTEVFEISIQDTIEQKLIDVVASES